MRLSAFPACALGAMFSGIFVGPVSAQTVTPLLDVRLRYETVKEEGFDRDAQAVTLRVRPGIEIGKDGWSALVQAEATTALVENYNSGTNGLTQFPLVADPRNVELDRAQVRYAGAQGFAATLGRQRIELLDRRFVGIAPFRQNERTFDAARLQWGTSKGWSVDLSYAWSVRTTNGRRGFGSRPTAIGGDNMFALVSHGSALGTVTGFAFLVDQDEAAVQGYRLSSQTYGVRFSGSYPIGSALKGGIIASYALQSDYANNPNDFAASYSLVEGSLGDGALTGKLGREVLGADDGRALTSVQTPLGALFGFQGWVDRFSTTPPDGLRDYYASVERNWSKVGGLDAIGLTVAYHHFTSDRIMRVYGDAWNLLATAKIGHALFSARYADYHAKAWLSDTRKIWLTVDWSL
ncbi:alginate export family protein [Sphingobium sp. CR28]|uniref:alginate export family protein n=1 Tax=Sphingobium sp. CR28 TaxID=3400272 RepID=UPI003FEF28BB